MYTATSIDVFIAAFSGAMAGFQSGKVPRATTLAPYERLSRAALAYAEQFDTTFASPLPDDLQLAEIKEISAEVMVTRYPNNDTTSRSPTSYSDAVDGVIAMMSEANAIVAANITNPIPFPSPPSGIPVIQVATVVGASNSLKSTIPATSIAAIVDGYYTAGDDGSLGGYFWDTTSVAADNGGTVINPTAHVGAGRWIGICSSPFNVRWFGAKGDGVTDDTTAFENAMSIASTTGMQARASVGSYVLSTLTFPAKTKLDLDRGALLLVSGSIVIPHGGCEFTGPLANDGAANGAGTAGFFNIQYTGPDGTALAPVTLLRVGDGATPGSSTYGTVLRGLILDGGGKAYVRGIHLQPGTGGGISYTTLTDVLITRPYTGIYFNGAVSACQFTRFGVAGKTGAFVAGESLDTGLLTDDNVNSQEESFFRDFFISTQWSYGVRVRAQVSGPVDITFERFSIGSAFPNTTAVAGMAIEGSGGKINILNPHIEAHGDNEVCYIFGSAAVAVKGVSSTGGYLATSGAQSPIKLIGFDGLVIDGPLMIANGNVPLVNNVGGGPTRRGGYWRNVTNFPNNSWTVPDFDSTVGFLIAETENLYSDQSYVPVAAYRQALSAILRNTTAIGTLGNGITYSVTAATSATPIVVTINADHSLVTGDTVESFLPGLTDGSGEKTVTVLSSRTFSLDGTTAGGAYSGGGNVKPLVLLQQPNGFFDWTMRSGYAFSINVSDGLFLQLNPKAGASTAGSHPHVIGGLVLRSNYWDGAANQFFDCDVQPAIDSEAPFHGRMQFLVKGTNQVDISEVCVVRLVGNAAQLDFSEATHATHSIKAGGVAILSINDNAGLTGGLGFYGHGPAAKQTVTGAKVDAVAASILAALVAMGLVIDGTT